MTYSYPAAIAMHVAMLICMAAAMHACTMPGGRYPISTSGRVHIVYTHVGSTLQEDRALAAGALAAWSMATGGAVTYEQVDGAIGSSYLAAAASTGVIAVSIYFVASDESTPDGIIGTARYRTDTGRHWHTEIRLYVDRHHSTYQTHRVLMHELGHAMGIYEHLPHPEGAARRPIMHSHDNPTQCITRADLDALCSSIACTVTCDMYPCDREVGQCE